MATKPKHRLVNTSTDEHLLTPALETKVAVFKNINPSLNLFQKKITISSMHKLVMN